MAKKKNNQDSNQNKPKSKPAKIAEVVTTKAGPHTKDGQAPQDQKQEKKQRNKSMFTMLILVMAINFLFLKFLAPKQQPVANTDIPSAKEQIVQTAEVAPEILTSLKETTEFTNTEIQTKESNFYFSNLGAKLTKIDFKNYVDGKKEPLNISYGKNNVNDAPFLYNILTTGGKSDDNDGFLYSIQQPEENKLNYGYLTRGYYYNTSNILIKSSVPANIQIKKFYRFNEKHQYNFALVLKNTSSTPISLAHAQYGPLKGGLAVSIAPGFEKNKGRLPIKHGYLEEGKFKKMGIGIIEKFINKSPYEFKTQTNTKAAYFIETNMFVHVIYPESSLEGVVYMEAKKDKSIVFLLPQQILQPNEVITIKFNGYLGPKDYKTLQKIDPILSQLSGIKPLFGVPISKGILSLLEFIYKFVKNYSIAIILLTILIKLIFYPLTIKQFKSMKGMKVIQPKMKELQEKYKNDPQMLQIKTMEMYKENKVNPFSGCLPALLQLPVFITLFVTLQSGAFKAILANPNVTGTFLWVTDLASPDKGISLPFIPIPIPLLPILVAISMYLSQKTMTPAGSSNDPQMKMMAYMPLLMLFISLNMPAGVLLYWAFSQFISAAQQMYISKKKG